MANDTDESTWQRTTDREQIRTLAGEADAAPTRASGPSDDLVLSTDADAERVEWERFFEWFEAEDRLLQYRRSGPDDAPVLRVVDRDYVADSEETARRERSPDDDGETVAVSDTGDEEPIATSDTGDDEPVTYDGRDRDDGDDAARRDG